MKKILSTFLALSIVVMSGLFAYTSVSYAADPVGAGGQAGVGAGGQADCDGTPSGGLQNPLKGVCSLGDFFYQVANFVYSLSYAVIAFFLIWSGFKFVVAQGNEEKLKDAKKTFYYTIVGAILLVGANVITEVVRTVINQFSRTQI